MLETGACPHLNEECHGFLKTIARSARQMNKLIDDLLDFSRTGRTQMSCIAIDMAEVVREMQRVTRVESVVLLCPGCGLEMLPPEHDPFATTLECPSCQARFTADEAMRHLHGGGGTAGIDG